MILTIAVILSLILCCSAFGKTQGEGDYREIERRKLHLDPKDLEHGPMLVFRVVACGGLVGVAMVFETWGAPWTRWELLDCLYMGGVAFGSFTSVHRLTLNKARGLDWRYVSPGNAYDRFFIKRFLVLILSEAGHGGLYGKAVYYTKGIHRAGTIAYSFEWFILALCVALLLFTNNT